MPRHARPSSPDAIRLLEQDHRDVEALFERLGRAKDPAARARTFGELRDALTLHGLLEEAVFYPAVGGLPEPEAQDLVAEAVEEHGGVKQTLALLEATPPDDPAFEAGCVRLERLVSHHVEEEERDLLPRARRLLGADRVSALGARIAAAKRARGAAAPRRPDAGTRSRR